MKYFEIEAKSFSFEIDIFQPKNRFIDLYLKSIPRNPNIYRRITHVLIWKHTLLTISISWKIKSDYYSL